MLSKISAEFENLESAEMTARRIRENVDGIKKITLAGTYRKLEANTKEEVYRIIPVAITSSNYVTVNTLFESSYGNYHISGNTKTRLDVTCDRNSLKKSESIIIGMGGLSVIKH